jgi:hypothetical protein
MIQSVSLSFYSFALLIRYSFIDRINKPGIIKFDHTLFVYSTGFNLNILHFTSTVLAVLSVGSV